MRAVFHHPESLRPGNTSAGVTQNAARRFAEIADAMRKRGLDPAAVAAAYGWPADLADAEILESLLALNQAAAG